MPDGAVFPGNRDLAQQRTAADSFHDATVPGRVRPEVDVNLAGHDDLRFLLLLTEESPRAVFEDDHNP